MGFFIARWKPGWLILLAQSSGDSEVDNSDALETWQFDRPNREHVGGLYLKMQQKGIYSMWARFHCCDNYNTRWTGSFACYTRWIMHRPYVLLGNICWYSCAVVLDDKVCISPAFLLVEERFFLKGRHLCTQNKTPSQRTQVYTDPNSTAWWHQRPSIPARPRFRVLSRIWSSLWRMRAGI